MLVRNLAEASDKKVAERAGMSKLHVTIVLLGEDLVTGPNGKNYFIDCWVEKYCGKGIEVKIGEIEGMDHESVVHSLNRGIGKLFGPAKGLHLKRGWPKEEGNHLSRNNNRDDPSPVQHDLTGH
jgi:hypothetical protein